MQIGDKVKVINKNHIRYGHIGVVGNILPNDLGVNVYFNSWSVSFPLKDLEIVG